MKSLFPFILFLMPFFSLAQQAATEVLNAEKSFAAYSVQHGTKAAFLHYADSSGLVFERGKPVKAIDVWSKREARPGVLNWYPVYGWLAQSGELGFTAGPWTFQPKTTNDSIVAHGQYNTVWHKTAGGEWKFLLDMGISNTPDFSNRSFAFTDQPIRFTPGTLKDLQNAEEKLVQATKEAGSREKAYADAVSKQAFLLSRNGHLPITAVSEIGQLTSNMPVITYKQDGAGMARSGDFGYVYGTTTINGKADNYLRIWRREGKEWKLVLEVLPY
jgi:ketosteroid isomerase-like protein